MVSISVGPMIRHAARIPSLKSIGILTISAFAKLGKAAKKVATAMTIRPARRRTCGKHSQSVAHARYDVSQSIHYHFRNPPLSR